MTEFVPMSTWSEPAHDFGESTQPAPFQEHRLTRPSSRVDRRPAAALAADVNELLESMARKRVPRLDVLRARVEDIRGRMQLGTLEGALHALHHATTAIDFLAGRKGGEHAAQFLQQGEALVAAAGQVDALAVAAMQSDGSGAPVARLVWIELLLESASLQKRVRQAARWLAEMDQDLVTRRKLSSSQIATSAIQELARRAVLMHGRLQTVHRLCAHARRVHALCEQLGGERAALCATLQDKVRPVSARLQETLHPLLEAARYRALVPTELIDAIDAHHELQVVLTQAAAQILRSRASDHELAAQLACMEQKARSVA